MIEWKTANISIHSPEVQELAAARWEREQNHKPWLQKQFDKLFGGPILWPNVKGMIRNKRLYEAYEEYLIILRNRENSQWM